MFYFKISFLIYCFIIPNLISSDLGSLKDYYEYWSSKYLKESQSVPGGKYVDYNNKQVTVSEAHGYGMLITVYMASHDNDQPISPYLSPIRECCRCP